MHAHDRLKRVANASALAIVLGLGIIA